MRVSTIFTCILLVLMQPAAYANGASLFTSADIEAAQKAWDLVQSKECNGKEGRLIRGADVDVYIEKLFAEELTFEDGLELMRATAAFRCSLSDSARLAYDSLLKEAGVRKFDLAAFAEGEIDLVVEALFPEEWQALVSESSHLHSSTQGFSKGAPLLVIGCWVTIIAGVGAVGACINDVDQVHRDCVAGRVCNPNGLTDRYCCDTKAQGDTVNCVITGGQNGPDSDYVNCCL